MATEAILVHDPGQVQFTAAATLASGQIVQLSDGRGAVIGGVKGFVSGERAVAYTRGVYDITCAAATTFSAGDPVYWDASANLAITAPAAVDDIYLGTAVEAVSNTQTTVRVDLNEGLAGAGATAQRSAWVTRKVALDHADTDEHTVVAAAENPKGLTVLACWGKITEQCGGDSEDQLVATLYDEDDNALAVMTVSDAAADAVGDLVSGTLTVAAGATGNALAVIPAGKSAYVKVSQATAGTGAAGAMDVTVLVAPLA